MNVNDYQNEFNKIISRKYFPSRLNSTRQKAFSKFLDIGLPTKKWEDWRHTDLSFLNKNNFKYNSNVIHARTKIKKNKIVSIGGRVLNVVSLGKDFKSIRKKIHKINEEGNRLDD